MEIYLVLFFLGLIGLAVGSFLGALTFRLPRELSVVGGRSHCPNCHSKITWFDNIPVLSFILLRGHCRNCHHKISLRYPLIEAATAFGFVGLWAFFRAPSPELLFLLFIFALLVSVFVIDLEHQIIPDNLAFLLWLAVLGSLLIANSPDFYQKLVSGFFAALFLLSIHLITSGRGMGLGDVKLALFGGTFFGWPMGLVWMFVSFLIGGACGIILLILGRTKLTNKIAFGPFLVVGSIVTFLFGNEIIRFFYR